jgi:hypothetical protein
MVEARYSARTNGPPQNLNLRLDLNDYMVPCAKVELSEGGPGTNPASGNFGLSFRCHSGVEEMSMGLEVS